MRTPTILLFLLATPSSAFALEQSAHQLISHDACIAAHLPQDFCERVGTEAYNVDSYEWSTPAAHSQMGEGAFDTACAAANASLERERSLGTDIRNSLVQLSSSSSEDLRVHIATQLGRALHTIQDDCAHHGMPNDQHAWASRMDACTGSKTSPDLAPEAATCARTETAAIFAAFSQEMRTAGVAAAALDNLPEGWTHWPKRGEVCAFLKDAENWSGTDRRWENAVVVPWLRDQLTTAITESSRSLGDACAAGVHIEVVVPSPHTNVSVKPPWCLKLRTFCIGKADGTMDDEAPPWDDSPDAIVPPADAGGCSAGNGSSSAMLLVLVGLALAARRRR